jgi:hypothetical protein
MPSNKPVVENELDGFIKIRGQLAYRVLRRFGGSFDQRDGMSDRQIWINRLD